MSEPPVDASQVNWVMVNAKHFFLEPFGTEYEPSGSGRLVVVNGVETSRIHGIEVDVHSEGHAAVWVPGGARVFWLPDLRDDDAPNEPWERRLSEIDVSSGEPVAE